MAKSYRNNQFRKTVTWVQQEHPIGVCPIKIQHVLQKDDWGCAIAVMAMVTNRTYQETKEFFADIPEGRLMPHLQDAWLREQGYIVERKHRYESEGQWPPIPFSFVHTCEVQVKEESVHAHMVVMVQNGEVYDPLTTELRILTDYFQVFSVASINYPTIVREGSTVPSLTIGLPYPANKLESHSQ